MLGLRRICNYRSRAFWAYFFSSPANRNILLDAKRRKKNERVKKLGAYIASSRLLKGILHIIIRDLKSISQLLVHMRFTVPSTACIYIYVYFGIQADRSQRLSLINPFSHVAFHFILMQIYALILDVYEKLQRHLYNIAAILILNILRIL